MADLALCVATYVDAAARHGARGGQRPRLARVFACAVPAVAVGLIPGVPDVVSAVLALAVFTGTALAVRAVPSELLDPVRGRLRR